MNTLSSLLKFIGNKIAVMYPVGCYFWTSDGSFNPAATFGGTWELMDEGMTLVSAGATYPITIGVHKDGGNKDAIIPAHSHSVPAVNVPIRQNTNSSGTGGKDLYYWNGDIQNYLQVPAHNTNSTGTSATNANMPPYKNAYCWHRVA